MRADILTHVVDAAKQVREDFVKFEQHSYLWLTDSDEYLTQFLKYSRPLTAEEAEQLGTDDFKVKEVKPMLSSFKAEVSNITSIRKLRWHSKSEYFKSELNCRLNDMTISERRWRKFRVARTLFPG